MDLDDSCSVIIPAGHAKAFELESGRSIRVINLEGAQVVDAWAFCLPDLRDFLSCEHTRSCLERLIPRVGDRLYSNRREAILTIVEDSSPGVHDMLLSACDARRYALLGHDGPHRSCADNLVEALAGLGRQPPELPSPFNIFENVQIDPDGRLSIAPPPVRAGDFITLRAEQDVILVLSSCPMDIALTNGPDGRVKPVRVERLDG